MLKDYHYIGLDVHKKTVAFCVKRADGEIISEGVIQAQKAALQEWASQQVESWDGCMEATMFSGWIYDTLKPYANELKVGHPFRIEAISSAKKKSDRIDASMLADLLRANLFPEIYMAPQHLRDLRSLLRYRNLIVRESTRMKNRLSCLLMECGVEYDSRRLHGKGYFEELLRELEEVPESVMMMLRMSRSSIESFKSAQAMILKILMNDSALKKRVEYLMTIPGVGVTMALTWACEIGEISRFTSRKKLISYCGLCGRLDESAGKRKRTPLSKQCNHHLQTMLIEVSKLAPRYNIELARVYDRENEKGKNSNEATIAVARKLVGYLFAVDREQRPFVVTKSS